MSQRIVINGQAYDSPEAMPPAVREQYEAALRLAGVSGQVQAKIVQSQVITMVNGKVVSAPSDLSPETRAELERLRTTAAAPGVHTTITINGAKYASRDEMPEDVRAQYDRALAALSSAGTAGKVEAAALRQLLPVGSDANQRRQPSWRVIGWLIIAALAVFYFLTRSHPS
ncbi:MAG TPA: hypothetical protein VFP39_06150 [Gemmatimonadales bacterium]|nr:hypothetical protein [Gemmatimonadales bacterium]